MTNRSYFYAVWVVRDPSSSILCKIMHVQDRHRIAALFSCRKPSILFSLMLDPDGAAVLRHCPRQYVPQNTKAIHGRVPKAVALQSYYTLPIPSGYRPFFSIPRDHDSYEWKEFAICYPTWASSTPLAQQPPWTIMDPQTTMPTQKKSNKTPCPALSNPPFPANHTIPHLRTFTPPAPS